VIATFYPVSILEADRAVAVDQHRSERLIAVIKGLLRQFYAASQVGQVSLGEFHADKTDRSVRDVSNGPPDRPPGEKNEGFSDVCPDRSGG